MIQMGSKNWEKWHFLAFSLCLICHGVLIRFKHIRGSIALVWTLILAVILIRIFKLG